MKVNDMNDDAERELIDRPVDIAYVGEKGTCPKCGSWLSFRSSTHPEMVVGVAFVCPCGNKIERVA